MILITYDCDNYHKVISETCREGDTVLEIGPHIGASTREIAKVAKEVVAVDKASQAKEAFAGKGPLGKMPENVTFVCGDTRYFETIDAVRALKKNFDVLAIDMGGGRFPDTVFKVWAVWSGVFRPRDSIIRNRGLGEFLCKAKIAESTLQKEFCDSGWLSQTGRKRPRQLEDGAKELGIWMGKKKT